MTKIQITKSDINSFAINALSIGKNWQREITIFLAASRKSGLWKGDINTEIKRVSNIISFVGNNGKKQNNYVGDEFGEFYDS